MYTAPWKDIAQLDYTRKEVWKYMTKLTCHWVREYNLDGFRTDVADRIPAEFWKQLRLQLDAIKPVFLLAEGHDPTEHPAHDASYDWFLPTAFWSVKEGKRGVDVFDTLLAREQRRYPKGFLRMRHATNHDVQRSGFAWPSMAGYYDQVFDEAYFKKTPLQDKFGESLKAYMILCATLPNSVPMIWNGQEIGVIEHTPRPILWQANAWTDFYTQLFSLYRENDALLWGDYQRIQVHESHPEMYIFRRFTSTSEVVVLINCSGRKQQISMNSLTLVDIGSEVFSGKEVEFKNQNLELAPWDAKVFTVKN